MKKFIRKEATKRYQILQKQKKLNPAGKFEEEEVNQCPICPDDISENDDMFMAPKIAETNLIYQDIID